ncbi:hypothetical protein [Streptomyces sp. NPDC057438]|uniref:hypothetical protein n=1 Tax=Streptomyces sp. NPDC057438 TaxID=3346133 RepID=UPI0036C61FC2
MPRAKVIGPAKPWIDDMLRKDAGAPRKQKLTARRIHQHLAQEHGFALHTGYFAGWWLPSPGLATGCGTT